MSNERVATVIDLIEANFRELAELTGVDHISAFLIRGNFSLDDYTNMRAPKFKEFREGGKK
jgi:hypothetical protein